MAENDAPLTAEEMAELESRRVALERLLRSPLSMDEPRKRWPAGRCGRSGPGMTKDTEKRLREWLAADWERELRIEFLDQLWLVNRSFSGTATGSTLNAAMKRFLDQVGADAPWEKAKK